MRTFRSYLKDLRKLVGPCRVLDVGTGAGLFLRLCKEIGWVVHGVEPNKFLTDYGNRKYGVNIYNGTLETAQREAWVRPVDVVTAWNVVERIPQPLRLLRGCNRVMKVDGVLAISYPNSESWFVKLLGRKKWFLSSRLLFFFTPRTAEVLIQKAGFKLISQKKTTLWVELGYIVSKLEAYFPRLGKCFGGIVFGMGLNSVTIPLPYARVRLFARKVKQV